MSGIEMKPMNCVQFEEIVHDLDRPGTRGSMLRESALAHAESCGRCAQLLTETESLDQALRLMNSAARDQGAPAWMEADLLREFRAARAATKNSWAGRRIAALATAAAVLLAAGASLMLSGSTAPGIASPQPAQANISSPTATGAATTESAGFIALPYADDPDGAEGGTVVRVQISGPALASLGMPVSLTGSATSVSADLLVSDDGTPQAIRLVSQEDAGQD
ncbi:MAG TPA: hypothetical protein VMB02_04785 [Candidatus Aquilonibacter sp.]|nr:hypothetical protein [Candidatus Aquilonibacter sp.]